MNKKEKIKQINQKYSMIRRALNTNEWSQFQLAQEHKRLVNDLNEVLKQERKLNA